MSDLIVTWKRCVILDPQRAEVGALGKHCRVRFWLHEKKNLLANRVGQKESLPFAMALKSEDLGSNHDSQLLPV